MRKIFLFWLLLGLSCSTAYPAKQRYANFEGLYSLSGDALSGAHTFEAFEDQAKIVETCEALESLDQQCFITCICRQVRKFFDNKRIFLEPYISSNLDILFESTLIQMHEYQLLVNAFVNLKRVITSEMSHGHLKYPLQKYLSETFLLAHADRVESEAEFLLAVRDILYEAETLKQPSGLKRSHFAGEHLDNPEQYLSHSHEMIDPEELLSALRIEARGEAREQAPIATLPRLPERVQQLAPIHRHVKSAPYYSSIPTIKSRAPGSGQKRK